MTVPADSAPPPVAKPDRIFRIFLQLGLTSFGGPVAHLGYFHHAFVQQRGWLSEQEYADLVALSQFLPGPASSQVGMGIGLAQAGFPGSLAAWLGFTLPSAAFLTILGYGIVEWQDAIPGGLLAGLKIAAVAVVILAVWHMAQRFCRNRAQITITMLAAAATLIWPSPLAPPAVIVLGGLAGLALRHDDFGPVSPARPLCSIRLSTAIACLSGFLLLLLALPLAVRLVPSQALALFDSFYRSGALVFGGGHVILPLLQSTVVSPGWVTSPDFLTGYGAAQAVPGPLFSLAAYLGTVSIPEPHGWQGALICLAGIYMPSFLLLTGAVPFWDAVKRHAHAQQALAGINAAVVGVLLAVLYDPIWISAVSSTRHFILVLAAFTLLACWRVSPWLVVLLSALAGWVLLL